MSRWLYNLHPPGLPAHAKDVQAGALALHPGLYMHVIDGLIQLSNKGTANFSAGQFGFTASLAQPPVVPSNPCLKFSPPPAFSAPAGKEGGAGGSAAAAVVDCEVR